MGRRALAAIFGVPALLVASWTVVAGKDLNWDLLHYHYYVAHSLIAGRSGQDYFAARTESYLNPLGYVPFYLMVDAGWHSVLVSMLLAAVHSASIGLLYLLSWRLFAHCPLRSRIAFSVLGAALGVATAVFWATAGTSFLDPLLAVPMLGGVVLLLGARSGDGAARIAAAGALFGLAAALKYSNAFFALAGLVLAATIPAAAWKERGRAIAAYAVGGAVAVGVVAGPWLARLWREFGNPFFPHLNGLFGSPEAPPFMLASGRFAPQGLGEALAFPFTLASAQAMTYGEINAPDLRFATAAAAAVAFGLAALIPVLRRPIWDRAIAAGSSADAVRLFAFFLISLAVWVGTSGNARYGLLVLLLVGPCCAYVLERVLPRYGYLTLGTLLAVQIAVCTSISPSRWFVAERWSKSWFGFAAPERARKEPALYLTVEPQAMTAAIPFLHPASSFANLHGQDAATAGWKRLALFRERNAGPVRVLGRGLRLQPDGKPRADVVETFDWTLLRFGYRVDTSDCFSIDWQPDDSDALSRWSNQFTVHSESRRRIMSLVSCALAAAKRDPAEIEEERRISELFSRIEDACPRLFHGLTAVTERIGPQWARNYPALDARMETKSGRVILGHWFKLRYYDLGTVEDWASADAARPAACAGRG
jgi:hypothetical protein